MEDLRSRITVNPKQCGGRPCVRDYLETLDWNKQPPGPTLPPEIVAKTQAKYLEAYERLTGKKL